METKKFTDGRTDRRSDGKTDAEGYNNNFSNGRIKIAIRGDVKSPTEGNMGLSKLCK